MKIIKLIGCSCFQILSLIFFIIFLLGALNIHFNDRNNYCVMTYMFEYPQFVRITVPENNNYPQYGLYAYSEGRLTERARKMWFDGIPVIFLPGNLGSYKQSRSLASIALRKATSNIQDYHFDFFTVDYSEELSGLYGGVLEKQTEFASFCITKILSLYKNNKYINTVPTSVILIGHSMGGVIAKRLLAYPGTINTTNIAITLAAPLEAPVLNFDITINDYYMTMDREWTSKHNEMKSKLLLSFGGGPRDILVPSSLTGSEDSDINTLTTAVPGVWVSPDHVSIVWCKQFIMTINKFLFSIVNVQSKQIIDDKQFLLSQARHYFQANRSMTLNQNAYRSNTTMIPDGFWYEDNRRVYQISRPEITKTTYLMIRLVSFPQNRFVAVESVNVEDKEWLYGCAANNVYGSHRYCKTAVSLNELSRWTGTANNLAKRKLSTIHLHSIMDMYPEWTHVIIKVSPTRKPITLNVDVNDHASRQITVDLPYMFSFGKTVILKETEQNSLYYELLLPELNHLHQTYYLYVEPLSSCKATQHHASAEVHVPWAKNHEYHHYFTHLKQTPMKIRLFKNNPNVTNNMELTESVKITLLLDPQCIYSISISPSIYHQIAQLVRNYSPLLIPYVAAVILLATRSNIINLRKNGACISMHNCLISDGVKPYYVLVFARLGMMLIISVPMLAYVFETANSKNAELRYFLKSLLGIPAYMTAIGIVNILAAVVLVAMVFSSQLAHRLLFRIVWRGSSTIAEKMASGLRKIPVVVSSVLLFAVQWSCGAAALAAGAVFYSFIISKIYEEYLEDYVYRLMAKMGSKLCYFFKSKKSNNNTTSSAIQETKSEDKLLEDSIKAIEGDKDEPIDKNKEEISAKVDQTDISPGDQPEDNQPLVPTTDDEVKDVEDKSTKTTEVKSEDVKTASVNIDKELSGLNFHMMMFFLWMVVTIANVPALLSWARNYKYTIVMKSDTSYYPGIVMLLCAGFIWQIEGPRSNLKYYDLLSQVLFVMAVFILILAPLGLYYVNYVVTLAFLLITLQQILDKEENLSTADNVTKSPEPSNNEEESTNSENVENSETFEDTTKNEEQSSSNGCECNENQIYKMIKKFREKLSFAEE